MVVADNPANVAALGAAADAFGGRPLKVVVDIDPGFHRTGVASPEAAVALARRIVDQGRLRFAGVQCYCGADQHIEGFEARREAIVQRTAYLSSIIDALGAADLPPPVVTGSGTGTHAIDAALGVFTEFQVGSYIFMDSQYGVCDLTGDGAQAFETALMVDARVVSASHAGMVTVDAGLKAFATEAGPPQILAGAVEGSTYRFFRRRTRRGAPAQGPEAAGPGRGGHLRRPALRSHREPLRDLPRGARRHPGRHLADPGAGALAVGSPRDQRQHPAPSAWIGGQATVPYEQNTQQSPALGFSSTPQPVQS